MEEHVLGLIRRDFMRLRDEKNLYEYVAQELQRLSSSKMDASEQLQRRLAELDQKIAQLRDHLMSLNKSAAQALGLYDQASRFAAEREQIETHLSATRVLLPAFPSVEEVRLRVREEFDRLEQVIALGSVEEKRSLIACYVQKIKADPDRHVVEISLYPILLSQKVARVGVEPTLERF